MGRTVYSKASKFQVFQILRVLQIIKQLGYISVVVGTPCVYRLHKLHQLK